MRKKHDGAEQVRGRLRTQERSNDVHNLAVPLAILGFTQTILTGRPISGEPANPLADELVLMSVRSVPSARALTAKRRQSREPHLLGQVKVLTYLMESSFVPRWYPDLGRQPEQER